jgi:hypothetical protein
MLGRCSSCHHWTAPKPPAKRGRCKLDNALVHGGYGCISYHATIAAVSILVGLRDTDIVRLRGDHGDEADQLREAWLMVWDAPDDEDLRRMFERLLRAYRSS